MQPTQDRLGMDGVRFSTSMARIGLWALDMGERRIGETGTERHVRTAKIVVGNPRFQDAPQMRFRQGNQPIETLATNGSDDSFADRIGLRAVGR